MMFISLSFLLFLFVPQSLVQSAIQRVNDILDLKVSTLCSNQICSCDEYEMVSFPVNFFLLSICFNLNI